MWTSKALLFQRVTKVEGRRTLRSVLLTTASLFLVGARAAWPAQPVFELVALPGLTDIEHTDVQGNHVSMARAVDGTGLVFGRSLRVPPAPAGPAWHGVTGWVYDPDTGVTTRAALDAVPYAPVGQSFSNGVSETTALGFGLGATACGDFTFPRYVWAFDSHDRVETFVGLSDPDHTNPVDGHAFHPLLPYSLGRISRSGHITGSTIR